MKSAEKTKTHSTVVQQKAAGTSFFRKAGEESFFGEKTNQTFFNKPIQAKLNVSSPDDPQEKEADAVAEHVMRMADPVPVASNERKEELHRSADDHVASGESEMAPQIIQSKEDIEELHRKEEREEEKVHAKPLNSFTLQAKEDNKEEKVHPKLYRSIQRSSEENTAVAGDTVSGESYYVNRKTLSLHHSDVIQRSGRGPPGDSIPFGETLASSKGGGSAMPDNTKQFMESRFNADFGGVKIHTGSTAENLSTNIHAQAFTHGNDIYFNSGKYSPETAAGGTLLAHELTHTLQQGASKPITPSQNNNTSLAAKSEVQRQQTSDVSSQIKSAQQPSICADATVQKKHYSNERSKKSLQEIRKETFNIDRKDESLNHENIKTGSEEKSVQSKNELSNVSVDKSGNLHNVTSPATTLSPAIVQPKEENEIRKEDEDKKQLSTQQVIHKKTVSGLQRKNKNETQTQIAVQGFHSIQSQTAYNNSSLNYEADAATSVISNESDRGPPLTQVSSNTGPVNIQRSWLGDAWDAVSDVVGEAADIIARGIDAAKEWILARIKTFVQNIPGYNILALILQHDPITHEPVERSGRNILLAGLQLIPGGGLFQQVLERIGAINDAAAWIDGRMSDLLSMVSGIGNRFTQFMNGLSLDDIGNPEGVLNRVADLFRGIFNDVTGFMSRAAGDFLEMIKRIMLRLIVDFVRTRIPRLYPLLRVALGHDPVTGEDVPRNGHNILYAALDATDAGREQRRQMEETGTFDRVAAWIDRAISVFSTAYDLLRQAFTNLWSYVTIENLFSPIETFTRIYNDFAAPVSLVGNFLRDLAVEIVRLIKEALLRRLRDYARTVRGYFLVTVIIGSDPFTHENVPRTIPNIIRGFMSLMEGGEEQYRQMEESGAIARTTQQINAAVARLNMTPASIIQLFINLWNSFSLRDLAHPVDAFMRIVRTFGEPIGRLIDFVIEIVKIVVHVILEIMNFPFDLINNIITRAMAAFDRIKRDPIAFLKNLLRAIKQGFIQFFDHILTHLLNGLTGWLMSELRDANVPAPTDFSLRGIIGWVLQVLGISMEAIWAKLAAHPRIGPQRVARIRSMISTLEGIWTFIKDVQERGVAAIWDKIQEQLSNLWNTVLDAVKNWVMERIISQVTARLLSMLDPTGIMAVINSAIAIYRAIQSFMRYLRQMLEVVNSFVNGVADIAEGNVTTAATYLENTMGRAMPIVVGFLANQVGLSGVGRRIAEIIGRVREMVDQALTWLVNKAVDTGMNLLDRVMAAGRSARDAVLGWLGFRQRFTTQTGVQHTIYLRDSSSNPALIIESTPTNVAEFFDEKTVELNNSTTISDAEKNRKLRSIQNGKNFLRDVQNLMNSSKMTNQNNPMIPTLIGNIIGIVIEIDPGAAALAVPNAEFTPGFNTSKASSFSAKYVYNGGGRVAANHVPGTEPSENELQAEWQVLRDMQLSNRWVRFHIFNHNIGGIASNSNLIPTPSYYNNEYRSEFESQLVGYYNSGFPVWLRGNATYRADYSGLFVNVFTAEAGAMKLQNNEWIEDPAKRLRFNKSVDLPQTDNYNINILISSIDDQALLRRLTTVSQNMINILRSGQPAGGYTNVRQMERVLVQSLIPGANDFTPEHITTFSPSSTTITRVNEFRRGLSSVNWTF